MRLLRPASSFDSWAELDAYAEALDDQADAAAQAADDRCSEPEDRAP